MLEMRLLELSPMSWFDLSAKHSLRSVIRIRIGYLLFAFSQLMLLCPRRYPFSLSVCLCLFSCHCFDTIPGAQWRTCFDFSTAPFVPTRVVFTHLRGGDNFGVGLAADNADTVVEA